VSVATLVDAVIDTNTRQLAPPLHSLELEIRTFHPPFVTTHTSTFPDLPQR